MSAETTITTEFGIRYPSGRDEWPDGGKVFYRQDNTWKPIAYDPAWQAFVEDWHEKITKEGAITGSLPQRIKRDRIVIVLKPEVLPPPKEDFGLDSF